MMPSPVTFSLSRHNFGKNDESDKKAVANVDICIRVPMNGLMRSHIKRV